MAGSVLDSYLTGVDPRAERLVRALDSVILATRPDLDVAVKYKILMYTLAADWRTWVCAVDASRKRVSLRFLYGVLMDDPLAVLRSGSSVLMTWDFGFEDDPDAAAVGAYVAEAVARYPDYKARSAEVLAASRAAAAGRPRRKDG